ncbi:UDP-N-acetylenolpyruvoylglucosamine reductase [Hyella patelloides LEGE 07179]|uniref:UDP-N-acetylenolpyruvoylglucosamine reductase n=1 Tax=Hyella patelloides LEGE 07179 TaxID=945734 RepID=A0A563VLQ1_9CYAN|nr:FAD-binding protein [Hyella patelloides]VEP12235.1 UDP-N-acetylenolpyruvoylglucosamine reductase [Hyella patelloides LEGE 07179]
MLSPIQSITSNKLSYYRTTHNFKNYAEFETLEQFKEYCIWAKANNRKIYILGNGSNTLFARKNIKSLILKNQLHKKIDVLSKNKIRASSSTLIRDVLKYCFDNSLDSFYYLASVPATIGGALAMNAGRGKSFQRTIYDFVETVDFFDFEDNRVKTLTNEEIVKSYRQTIFTGIQSKLILSAVFKFQKIQLEGNPITQRCIWSKENQDYSAPNCGSVFKEADPYILNKLRGWHINKASFSSKTNNWILNKSESYIPLMLLITAAKIIHFLKRKIAKIEIIFVD